MGIGKDVIYNLRNIWNRLLNGEAMHFPGMPDEKAGVVKEVLF